MKKILLLGSGRSSTGLIKYLVDNRQNEGWQIEICDANLSMLQERMGDIEDVALTTLDASNETARFAKISEADIVISLLPASLHHIIAEDCIKAKKNMVTASYIAPEMDALDQAAKDAGVLILNEMGLDPGIDHLSGKKLIDDVRKQGGDIFQFESFTGGLIAPECEGDNPWKYKFTWNPRNVVLASQGAAVKFIDNSRFKYIPYHRVFRRTELVDIPGHGRFEGYANRDSLKYREVYGFDKIETIYRGTFRRPGYCKAWNVFVQLGATDDSYILEGSRNMTHRDFINSFLKYHPTDSVELKLMYYMQMDETDAQYEKLEWLGIFDDDPIGVEEDKTPAQLLEAILMKKWKLNSNDKDMIVMYHKLGYELNGERKQITSSMVKIGGENYQTAMSDCVGLPLGIATKLILNGEIDMVGVRLPIHKAIYDPALAELENHGVTFTEVHD